LVPSFGKVASIVLQAYLYFQLPSIVLNFTFIIGKLVAWVANFIFGYSKGSIAQIWEEVTSRRL